MRTLNQILTLIEQNKQSVAIINNGTFYFGDPWEFGKSNPITYPFTGVRFVSSGLNGAIHSMTFNIFLCDLVHKDESNEQTVLSDMELSALRLFSEIKYDLELSYPATLNLTMGITPFTERFADEVSGVEMNITVEQHFDDSTCT